MSARRIELELNGEAKQFLPCENKLRCWFYENALTIGFLLVLFAITWIIQIASLIYG
jgi:hypothetical protein